MYNNCTRTSIKKFIDVSMSLVEKTSEALVSIESIPFATGYKFDVLNVLLLYTGLAVIRSHRNSNTMILQMY